MLAAVDVERIIQSVYRGERERAWGILTPADTDFYDKSIEGTYGFNPELANKLLDDAGWTERDADGFRTKDGKRLTIEVVQSQSTVRDQRDILLQAVQAQARQNAGIDIALQYVDAGTYSSRQKDGEYGIIPNSTTTQENGVTIYFHYLPRDKGGSINYSRTEDPKVSQWLDQGASTLDPKSALRLTQNCNVLRCSNRLMACRSTCQPIKSSHHPAFKALVSALSSGFRKTPTTSGFKINFILLTRDRYMLNRRYFLTLGTAVFAAVALPKSHSRKMPNPLKVASWSGVLKPSLQRSIRSNGGTKPSFCCAMLMNRCSHVPLTAVMYLGLRKIIRFRTTVKPTHSRYAMM